MSRKELNTKTITVCDVCLRACCWQGILMCDESREAGTVEKTINELKKLNLEHPIYWDIAEKGGK